MYTAVVTKIAVMPHTDPEVHSLAIGNVLGNTVVVGKGTEQGALGVFFETDGQLSPEFCAANDLIRKKDLVTGLLTGGFFEENRRVRALKLRGVKSDGFWIPVKAFEFCGDTSMLQEGYQFTMLNEVPICNKYMTPATQRAGNKNVQSKEGVKRGKIFGFQKHYDTDQFRKSVHRIRAGDVISITSKMHGTSGRFGRVMQEVIYPKKSWQWRYTFVANWLHDKFGRAVLPLLKKEHTFNHFVGSRNVDLSSIEEYHKTLAQRAADYGADDKEHFRFGSVNNLVGKLKKGEVLYYEIVGWSGPETPIMKPCDTSCFKDKQLEKRYGKIMPFSYGCEKGELDIFVYRISMVDPDGGAIDLGWNQVKQRCAELGVKHVPEVCNSFVYDGDEAKLRELVESLTEGTDTTDARHIREGVVIRAERYPQPLALKNKSFLFRVSEGHEKMSDDYVDAEEAA